MLRFFITFINMPIYLYATAFTLATLWGWFITPVFGVPVPAYPFVLGLSLIASWPNLGQTIHLSLRFNWEEKEDDSYGIINVIAGYLILGVLLLMGYIYTLFV